MRSNPNKTSPTAKHSLRDGSAGMSRTCQFCGEGDTREKGTPAYYDAIDGYAHVDCAHQRDISDG